LQQNNTKPTIYKAFVTSSIGYWTVVANDLALTKVLYSETMPTEEVSNNAITTKACLQLEEYFDKKRQTFDLPLDLESYPQFYQAVWQELLDINYGAMCSYGDIAVRLDNPKAVRAVGMANGKNPIPIIVPCHRVIGKDRSLTGYASGLKVKKWLLELEGAIAGTPTLF